MKKSVKIISIILVMLTIALASTAVFATDKPSNLVSYDTSNTNEIKNVGNKILGIVRTVGTIVAVVMIIILGIKYMMGSAEEKAEYKKTLLPYFIGAILIFAATNLADIIYSWAGSI